MYRIQKKARAIQNYNAVDGSELSYIMGDVITILEETSQRGPGYWHGEINGRVGDFLVKNTEIMVVDPNAPNKDMIGPAHTNVTLVPKYEDKPPFDSDHVCWRFSLFFAIAAGILLLASLCLPWYYVTGAEIQAFQFQGIQTYNVSEVNPILVVSKRGVGYRSYLSLNMPRMHDLNAISAAFGSLAFVIEFFVGLLVGFRMKGFWPRMIWYLPFMQLIVVIFNIISSINYFVRFANAYFNDVNRRDNVPSAFKGETWGPTAGFLIGAVAIIPAFLAFVLIAMIRLGVWNPRVRHLLKG
eukprot:TRINITY_DN2654_c0_g1_i1.p1 TRINITY_DN2654_c0_g1~~TRINITY_DN2654_c0_g1_i1.p1  ORF type:complete len:298 (-),score=73.34 TRINITY_DN2654_c0_g1_i1:20-913(-)